MRGRIDAVKTNHKVEKDEPSRKQVHEHDKHVDKEYVLVDSAGELKREKLDILKHLTSLQALKDHWDAKPIDDRHDGKPEEVGEVELAPPVHNSVQEEQSLHSGDCV